MHACVVCCVFYKRRGQRTGKNQFNEVLLIIFAFDCFRIFVCHAPCYCACYLLLFFLYASYLSGVTIKLKAFVVMEPFVIFFLFESESRNEGTEKQFWSKLFILFIVLISDLFQYLQPTYHFSKNIVFKNWMYFCETPEWFLWILDKFSIFEIRFIFM